MTSLRRTSSAIALALFGIAPVVSSADFNIDMEKTPCAAWNAFQYFRSIGQSNNLVMTVTKDTSKTDKHRTESCGNTESAQAKDVAVASGKFQAATELRASCDEFPPASTNKGGDDGGANIMYLSYRENSKAGAALSAKTGTFTIGVINWDADRFKDLVGDGNWKKETGVDQPLATEGEVGWCYYDPD